MEVNRQRQLQLNRMELFHINNLQKDTKGNAMIEVLLTVSLLIIIVTPFIYLIIDSQKNLVSASEVTRSTLIAEEGLEAVRYLRDLDYATLVDGTYGIEMNAGMWSLTSNPSTVGKFSRQIIISSVHDDMKEVVSKVTWDKGNNRAGTVFVRGRFVNPETTIIDAGGNVTPTISSCIDLSGGQDAMEVVRNGSYAYVITNSASESFVVLDISDPFNITEVHRVNLQNNPRDVTIQGDYVYIASKHNTQELQIIDITNPLTAGIIGSFDLPSVADASVVRVDGDLAYLGRDASSEDEFYIIEHADKVNPSLVGSLNIDGGVSSLTVQNSIVYVGSENGIVYAIDIQDPQNPFIKTTLGLLSSADTTAIAVSDILLYIGDKNGEVYVYDIGDVNNPVFKSSIALGDEVTDIEVDGDTLYIATTASTEELAVFDVTNSQTPTQIGTFDNDASILGIDFNSVDQSLMSASTSNPAEVCFISL